MNIEKKIFEIIDSRCTRYDQLMQYTDTYTWIAKDNEPPHVGFRREYPNEFQEEVDAIFDEIHPY